MTKMILLDENCVNCFELSSSIAKSLLETAKEMDYLKVQSCGKNKADVEIIYLEVEVSIPQRPINPIQEVEDIAIVIRNDSLIPEVFAIREDFPLNLSHVNLKESERPVSLCLYEEPPEEIIRCWTSFNYLERIRKWFSMQAKGELHENDQPLEPFMIGHMQKIILPGDFLHADNLIKPLYIYKKDEGASEYLFAQYFPLERKDQGFFSLPIILPNQMHGVIKKSPTSLGELNELLQEVGFDFEKHLQKKLNEFKDQHVEEKYILQLKLIILLIVPLSRNKFENSEKIEIYPFLLNKSFYDVLEKVGIRGKAEGFDAYIIDEQELNFSNIKNFPISLLNPFFSLNAAWASSFNGIENNQVKIGLIGAGAIGSQVFMNFARMGFGRWNIIDHDNLNPHNLARHALTNEFIGENKAFSLSEYANKILDDNDFSVPYPYDVLKAQDNISGALNDRDVIIDMSTSIAAQRYLSIDAPGSGRRFCAFMNSAGSDFVFLAEDKMRESRLDLIEMQYYRCLIYESGLKDHYANNNRIRYARSCRDISSTISQENVNLATSLLTKAIRKAIENNDAELSIWRINHTGKDVSYYSFKVSDWKVIESNKWEIYIDQFLINKISEARMKQLPNETGGVLLGHIDTQRKYLYLVDSILAPEDSEGYPNAYIRGIDGIYDKLSYVQGQTNFMLNYIGEWHSHTEGISLNQSEDDKKLFAWQKETMVKQGLPAVMLIAGDKTEVSIFVEDA